MTDTEVTEGVTVETTPTPPAEAGFSLPESQEQGSETTTPERDWETEAREMGWIPEAEFKGDKRPAKFIDAKEFVERGETVLPFVQRENRRLKEEREKKEREFEERIAKLDRMSQASLKVMQARHAQELEALKASRDAAVEKGDVTEFRRIDKQITDHEAAKPTDVEPEVKADPVAEAQRVQKEWTSKNDWYGKDAVMTGYANYVSQGFLQANPNITMEENLRLTDEAMRKQFPTAFKGKTDANGHAPVEGLSDPKSPNSRTPLFDKLPNEAKAMAKQNVADGLYKSVEDWAKAYNS